MNIDKDTLLNLLHSNGQHSEADQAATQLPDQVDTDQHAGLLSKLGVDLPALLAKFTGGAGGNTGGGGLGGLLGGLGGQTGSGQTGSGLGGLLGQSDER